MLVLRLSTHPNSFKQTSLNQLLITIIAIFSLTFSYGQADAPSLQNLELTKKNIKRIFSLAPDFACADPDPEWTACYNTDSTYSTADTVRLYSDSYYYLTTECCYITSWIFSNSTHFNLLKTHVCQEPPLSSIHFDNCGLKIKFKKRGDTLMLSIHKDGNLKDRFILLSLANVEMHSGKQGYVLSMLRSLPEEP